MNSCQTVLWHTANNVSDGILDFEDMISFAYHISKEHYILKCLTPNSMREYFSFLYDMEIIRYDVCICYFIVII